MKPNLLNGCAGITRAPPSTEEDDQMSEASLPGPQRRPTAIEVTGLRKRFGPTLALDGMTFTVEPGQVTGFVGPNGAGKSTTMRVILGLDAPDAGTALIGGRRYASLPRPLTVIGSLLDAAALQPSRSARNHLLWLAHSQGLGARRVDEVIGQAGLAGVARRKAGGYSLGMRQRLGIAAAMLGDPPVIMLDEPFNGMDPEGIVWMRGFLRGLAGRGRAVLVSSHLMSELEDTADRVVVVGRGTVIADTTVAALLAAVAGDQVTLRTSATGDAAAVLEAAGATVAVAADGGGGGGGGGGAGGQDRLTIAGLTAERVVALLSAKAVPFSEIAARRATLEQAYLELTRDATVYRAAGLGTGRSGPAGGPGGGPADGTAGGTADGTVTR
jgi:ABC-2 type transport system ATP-binding protein